MTAAMNPRLRLTSTSGTEYVARFVYRGDAYGDGGRLVHESWHPLVEFVVPTGTGERVVGAYPAENVGSLGVESTLLLPAKERERLHLWLEDPSALSEAVVFLVGGDDELAKAAVALRGIGLEPRHNNDAGRALVQAKALPPTLVVVGQQTLQLEPFELVRRLHAAPETHELPIVALGGDAEEAREAGASLHLPEPVDYRALVERVAALLDFV